MLILILAVYLQDNFLPNYLSPSLAQKLDVKFSPMTKINGYKLKVVFMFSVYIIHKLFSIFS